MMKKTDETRGSKIRSVTRHIPISASIATNVPGFPTKHILSINPESLSPLMFDYFDLIQENAAIAMRAKMQPLIEKVQNHYNLKEKEKFTKRIESYCTSIPIVGFNSSFYDINLLTDYGFVNEILKRDHTPFVIKSGTRYKVIKTKQFIFLDQMSYCAPGTSLSKFIKAYDTAETKSFFP